MDNHTPDAEHPAIPSHPGSGVRQPDGPLRHNQIKSSSSETTTAAHAGKNPRKWSSLMFSILQSLLVLAIIALLFYSFFNRWDRIAEKAEANKRHDSVIRPKNTIITNITYSTEDPAKITGITYDFTPPPGRLQKIKTFVIWFALSNLVLCSSPRMIASAGQQLRAMIPAGSFLSKIVTHDGITGALNASALGFVASGVCFVMIAYRSDLNCDWVDPPPEYLRFEHLEHVKDAVRTWGKQVHALFYLAVALDKVAIRPVESTVQYVILGATIMGLTAWGVFRSVCFSTAVYHNIAFHGLLACEGVWLVGRARDLFEGDRKARLHLLWHLSVLYVLRWAPLYSL